MKRSTLILTILLQSFLFSNSFSQTGWFVAASGVANIAGIFFIDSQTGWICVDNPSPGKVFKSTDGGYNWLLVFEGQGPFFPHSICFSNANNGYIASGPYGPTNYPIWYTWSGGTIWDPIAYTSHNGSNVRSITGGYWACGTMTTFGVPNRTYEAIIQGGVVYTLAETTIPLTRIRTGANDVYTVGVNGKVYRGTGVYMGVGNNSANLTGVSSPAINTVYVVGDTFMYKTTNNGTNWTSLYPLNPPGTYNDVYFINQDTGWVACVLYGGSTGAMLRSTNGGINWVQQYAGLSGSEICFIDNLTGWVSCGNSVLKTETGGNNSQIATPVLLSPANGATASSLTPQLDWGDIYGAIKYRIQLSTDSLFNTVLIDDSSSITSNYSVQPGILTNYTVYYWRAAAKNNTLWSAFSNPWHFRTYGLPAPVSLYSPSNNSTGQPIDISFNWYGALQTLSKVKVIDNDLKKSLKSVSYNQIDAVNSYWFELTTDTVTFAGLIKDTTLTDTTKTVTGLNYATSYYWRVKAKNELGWGTFSNWWKFTTISNIFWIPKVSGVSTNLRSIYFTDALTGWACGNNGVIIKTTNGGENWVQQTSGVGGILYDLNFIDANTGWAAGESASIIKTTNSGLNWFVLSPPAGASWFKTLYFINPNTGFVTGVYAQYNYIYKTTDGGSNWTSVFSWTNILNKISYPRVLPALTGFVCGFHYDGNSHGALVKTTNEGVNWTYIVSGTGSNQLRGTCFVNASTGWTVGDGGTVLFTSDGGNSFTFQNSSVSSDFQSVYFVDANTGCAVGSGGTIISTSNGGANWILNISNSGTYLRSVYMVAPYIGWAVGDGGVVLRTGMPTLSAPNLVAPPNGAQNQSLTPLLDWDSIAIATSYQVQLSKNPEFSVIVLDSSGIINSNMVVRSGILQNDSTYFWRVRGNNISGQGPWSTIWSFRVITTLPSAPVLFNPLNNSVGVIPPVILIWYKTSNTVNYQVQLSVDSNFSSFIINDSTLTDSVKSISDLLPLTTYYWRVRGRNIAGNGNFSPVWKFKILGLPSQVNLVSPPNNSVNQPINLDFVWRKALDQTLFSGMKSYNNSSLTKDGKIEQFSNSFDDFVNRYWFQLTTDTVSFANLQQDSTLIDTIKSIGGLNYLTTYYWRVKARNEMGWGSFSVWYKFTTMPLPPAVVVLKIIPGGFFNSGTISLNMKDTISTYLIDSASCIRKDSTKGVLDSLTFTVPISFSNAQSGMYYLYIYHRNHVPVASKFTLNIIRNATVSYDFTTDSAKAYGNNMIRISLFPSIWGMIPGDANQDGFVDGLDQTIWIIQNGLDGYLFADFNGDRFVDGLDQTIWIIRNGLSYSVPCELSFENPSVHIEKLEPINNKQIEEIYFHNKKRIK